MESNNSHPRTNPTPEPMDTSSGHTHHRNASQQTSFPRELHQIDYTAGNTFSEDYNIPNYLPNMDNFNEIVDPENFHLNASKNSRDTLI